MADLAALALCAGLYSVPMYALIQLRSQPTHRARIIAANNILNALFMIASAGLAGALLTAGFTIPQIFLVTGLLNAVVAAYIFLLVPEYLLRFIALIAARLMYRFRIDGDEHIPARGAALLVCNHVSFVDAVLLMAASPRPIRFIMDHRIFATPVLGTLFRLAKAIPIAPQKRIAGDLRARLCAGAPGAGRGRAAVHLSRRRHHERRPASAVQGRRDEDPGDESGAGGAAGAAQPVGLVLLAQGRLGDDPAVPTRRSGAASG